MMTPETLMRDNAELRAVINALYEIALPDQEGRINITIPDPEVGSPLWDRIRFHAALRALLAEPEQQGQSVTEVGRG